MKTMKWEGYFTYILEFSPQMTEFEAEKKTHILMLPRDRISMKLCDFQATVSIGKWWNLPIFSDCIASKYLPISVSAGLETNETLHYGTS